MQNKLTFLYDGGCPLCRKETDFLKGRDKFGNINFVDINSANYDPTNYQNISFEKAMSNLHGILNNGNIIKGGGEVLNGKNNLIHSNGRYTAIVGIDDLVVVNTDDATLVVPKDKVEDVKQLVELLKSKGRNELI